MPLTKRRRGAARRSGRFGTVIVRTPSVRSAVDAFGVDRMRQHERAAELAVAALDLVILLARDARFAAALQRQPVVVHVDADLFARQARQLGGENERVRRFRTGRRQAPSPAAHGRKPLEAVLNADQIAERVPARKDHDFRIVARPSGWPAIRGGRCAKLVRFY